MTLIRGADVKIEISLAGVWTEITCEATSADWLWGTSDPLGPLTESEGGVLRVSIWDPTRKWDPANSASPIFADLKPGIGFRVTIDGQAAWTGVLQSWGRDRKSFIADLYGWDPIGMLSMRALPERQTLAPVVATTASQAQFVLDVVKWDPAKRVFPAGTTGVERGNHEVEGSALDALHRIRFAELGVLCSTRDGKVKWLPRAGETPPPISATINCGGAGLTDLWEGDGLGRVRNRAVVSGAYYFEDPDMNPDEYRTITTDGTFLQFAFDEGPIPFDLWANHILDALSEPKPTTLMGTIIPVGSHVADVVCSEYGARWEIIAPTGDKVVKVVGERVTLAPDWIEVEALTEDETELLPIVHAVLGAGSGHLNSVNAVYSTARAGSGVTVTLPATPTIRTGQQYTPGPAPYEIAEGFIWFDTSAIPAGATILKAVFAGMTRPVFTGGGTRRDSVLQLRSYNTGGWRTTLAAGDWIPGANIAANTTVRATFDTTRGDGFFVWDDSNLAGAVVKGGATQFALVSDRLVAGTAPVNGELEVMYVEHPRLRVTYTV